MAGEEDNFNEEEASDALRQKKEKSKPKKETKSGGILSPVRKGTSFLLKSSWLSVTTVFGFLFLGLPYIHLHLLGRVLSKRMFCPLGAEWVPEEYSKIAGAFGQSGKAMFIVEVIALFICDLAVFSCVIAALSLVVIVIEMTSGIFGWFVDLFA